MSALFFSHTLDFSPDTLYNIVNADKVENSPKRPFQPFWRVFPSESAFTIRCMCMLENTKPFPIKTRLSAVDIGVLVAVITLALILFILPTGDAGQVCVITWDGGEVTLPLTEPTTFTVESRGHTLTIAVENGTVSVTDTTCPDALCMAGGEISAGGEMLICVPAGVVIRIPGETNTGEDYIVG